MSDCGCNDDGLRLPVGPKGDEGKGYDATSSTTLNVLNTTPATTTLTISEGKAYVVGSRARGAVTASPTVNFFEGVVTAYDPSTGIMNIALDLFRGSGSYSAWNITLTGEASTVGSRNLSVDIDPAAPGTSVGIAETVIQTYSLAFGVFSTNNNDILKIRTYVNMDASVNAKTVQTKFGGNNISGPLTITDALTDRVHHEIDLIRKTATIVKAVYKTVQTKVVSSEGIEVISSSYETADIAVPDLDVVGNYPILIEVTGQASDAGDTITADGLIIQIQK